MCSYIYRITMMRTITHTYPWNSYVQQYPSPYSWPHPSNTVLKTSNSFSRGSSFSPLFFLLFQEQGGRTTGTSIEGAHWWRTVAGNWHTLIQTDTPLAIYSNCKRACTYVLFPTATGASRSLIEWIHPLMIASPHLARKCQQGTNPAFIDTYMGTIHCAGLVIQDLCFSFSFPTCCSSALDLFFQSGRQSQTTGQRFFFLSKRGYPDSSSIDTHNFLFKGSLEVLTPSRFKGHIVWKYSLYPDSKRMRWCIAILSVISICWLGLKSYIHWWRETTTI